MREEWTSFKGGIWEKEINVRDFIQKNYTPYEGDHPSLQTLQKIQKICGHRLWN